MMMHASFFNGTTEKSQQRKLEKILWKVIFTVKILSF